MKIGWVLSGPIEAAGPRIHGWNMHECLLKEGVDSKICYMTEYGKDIQLTEKEMDKLLTDPFDVMALVGFSLLDRVMILIDKAKKKGIKLVYIKTDNISLDLVRECDATIVINEFARKELPKELQNKIFVVFDGYEHDGTLYKQHTEKKEIKLVFVSNNVFSSFPQLNYLPENVSLKIIGPPQRRVEKYTPEKKMFTDTKFPFEYVLWGFNTVNKEILECDVAVIPYPDNHIDHNYVKRKSSNRLVMFMSLGLPTIVSPIAVYGEIIQDGKNGFIAETQEDWIKYIEYLRDHPEERKKIGNAARLSVINKFSKENQAEEYLKVFNKVIKK